MGGLEPPRTPPWLRYWLFVINFACFFACLPLSACQSKTNGSILYDHNKYVKLLAKVKKIVLNSSSNLHNFNFLTIFTCLKTYFLLYK